MTIVGEPQRCSDERFCDSQSNVPCDGILQSHANSSVYLEQNDGLEVSSSRPVRLINGQRAKNWRRRAGLKDESKRDEFKEKLLAERQQHEKFIESLLAKKKSVNVKQGPVAAAAAASQPVAAAESTSLKPDTVQQPEIQQSGGKYKLN